MANIAALSIGSLLFSVLALPNASLAAEYTLTPSAQTVHIGYFNAAQKPALTINSGDIVTIETAATAIDPADIDRSGVVPPSAVPDYVRTIYREVTDRGPGFHILTGPIFVNGAMPGDVLEVRILELTLPSIMGSTDGAPIRARSLTSFPASFCGSFQSTARRNPPELRQGS